MLKNTIINANLQMLNDTVAKKLRSVFLTVKFTSLQILILGVYGTKRNSDQIS